MKKLFEKKDFPQLKPEKEGVYDTNLGRFNWDSVKWKVIYNTVEYFYEPVTEKYQYKSTDEYLKQWKDELGIQAMEFLIERGTVKRYKQDESHRSEYAFSEHGLETIIRDCIVKFNNALPTSSEKAITPDKEVSRPIIDVNEYLTAKFPDYKTMEWSKNELAWLLVEFQNGIVRTKAQ